MSGCLIIGRGNDSRRAPTPIHQFFYQHRLGDLGRGINFSRRYPKIIKLEKAVICPLRYICSLIDIAWATSAEEQNWTKSFGKSLFKITMSGKTACNRRFGNMAAGGYVLRAFYWLLGFGSSRRINPGSGMNNELLFIHLAAAIGRRNKSCHIAKPLT